MKRRALAIPLDEIEKHFRLNARQDVKVIAPEMLSAELYEKLTAKGKKLKREEPVNGHVWAHSSETAPNRLCEAKDFLDDSLGEATGGPVAVSFANERAEQEDHFHRKHIEIYFSEHPMAAEFRYVGEEKRQDTFVLFTGGLIIFGPNVIHRMKLGGMTLIMELPSVPNDRVVEKI